MLTEIQSSYSKNKSLAYGLCLVVCQCDFKQIMLPLMHVIHTVSSECTTVDGRNPAPVEILYIYTRIYKTQ